MDVVIAATDIEIHEKCIAALRVALDTSAATMSAQVDNHTTNTA